MSLWAIEENMKADDFDESIRKTDQPTPNESITGNSKLRNDNQSTAFKSPLWHLYQVFIIFFTVKMF